MLKSKLRNKRFNLLSILTIATLAICSINIYAHDYTKLNNITDSDLAVQKTEHLIDILNNSVTTPIVAHKIFNELGPTNIYFDWVNEEIKKSDIHNVFEKYAEVVSKRNQFRDHNSDKYSGYLGSDSSRISTARRKLNFDSVN